MSILNVKKLYGARGDGVHDDTAAIQAALDDAAADGSTVYLPGVDISTASYVISDTLYLNANGVKLLGDGRASQITWAGASGGTMIGGHSAQHTPGSYSYVTQCEINSINIYAPNGDVARAIDFSGMSYSLFYNLLMQVRGTNCVAFYGQGNQGSAPYYNIFSYNTVIGDGSSGNVGWLLDKGHFSGGAGCNSTQIKDTRRAAALEYVVDCRYGDGLIFSGMSAESVAAGGACFRLGYSSYDPYVGTATAGGASTLTDGGAAWTVNEYAGDWLVIQDGTALGDAFEIASNTATVLTVSGTFSATPDATTDYIIARSGGTATAGGATSLTDSTKTWATNEWASLFVHIVDGTGVDQVRRISSNTATALTVSAAWTSNPSTDSVYYITDTLYSYATAGSTALKLCDSAINWGDLGTTFASGFVGYGGQHRQIDQIGAAPQGLQPKAPFASALAATGERYSLAISRCVGAKGAGSRIEGASGAYYIKRGIHSRNENMTGYELSSLGTGFTIHDAYGYQSNLSFVGIPYSVMFFRENIAAGTTTNLQPIRGGSGLQGGILIPGSYYLRAITVIGTGLITGGSGTIKVECGSTVYSSLLLDTSIDLKSYMPVSLTGQAPFRSQDKIAVQIQTTAGWLPTTVDISVLLLLDLH